MEAKPALYLFDFDGTLTRGDSLMPLLRHALGRRRFFALLLRNFFPLAGYALHLVPADKAKQRLFSDAFRGISPGMFQVLCSDFAASASAPEFRPDVVDALRKALDNPDASVAIVSASMEAWILPLLHRIPNLPRDPVVISTMPEIDAQGKLTGRFATPNCKGSEKLRRIREVFGDMSQYYVTAYGDSRADIPMLDAADVPVWVKEVKKC